MLLNKPRTTVSFGKGFTLLELVVVLGIISILSQGYFAWKNTLVAEAVVQRTVDGFILITEALYAYRLDRSAWPININHLTPNYLPNFSNANGMGRPYSIQRSGTGMLIRTQMETRQQQVAVTGAFPSTGRALGTAGVSVAIPRPGLESANSQFLLIDGTRPMRGQINLNGNSVNNGGSFRGSRGEFRELRLSTYASADGSCSIPGQVVHNRAGGLLVCSLARKYITAGQDVKMLAGRVNSGSTIQTPNGYRTDDCLVNLSANPTGNVHIDNQNFSVTATPVPGSTNRFRVRGVLWLDRFNRAFLEYPSTTLNYKMLCVANAYKGTAIQRSR